MWFFNLTIFLVNNFKVVISRIWYFNLTIFLPNNLKIIISRIWDFRNFVENSFYPKLVGKPDKTINKLTFRPTCRYVIHSFVFFNTCVASLGFFLAFSGGPSFLHYSAWNNWHLVLFQTAIGADIMMQLDDVVDATHTDPQRFEEARHRTVRWLDRCIEAHKNTSKQNLFPIVQGSKVFENHIKSLIQHCERSELCLHFEWIKVN